MLQKSDIELFYKHLHSLALRFPVATMVDVSGMSKGTVSDYLSRKKEPSENFIRTFYEKYGHVFTTNPFTKESGESKGDQQKERIEKINDRLLDMIEKQLDWMREKVDTNLDATLAGLASISNRQSVDREVVYRSLSRMEKKDPDALLKEADRILSGEKGKAGKPGKQQSSGKNGKG